MQILCRLAVAAVALSSGCGSMAQAEPLRIGHLTWVGLGPLFVAKEKGFFAREGVEVELINMAIHEAMYAGLFAGQIDMIDATVDDMLPYFDPEQPYACVFTLTELLGADGIVATNDIRSIADLKGKTVAFAEHTVSQFYLNVLLREAGLSQADIAHVEMSADAAGNAFLMQEVDAAVSWEPWLTQGKEAEHGHLLADTSDRPGLVADCLVTRTNVLEERLPEFRALARPGMRLWTTSRPIPTRPIGSWRATSAAGSRTRRSLPRP